MSKTLDFKIFCLVVYKTKHGLSGEQTFDVFKTYNVFRYLEDCYDVLHTLGADYLVEDIDKFISSHKITA